MIIFGKNKMTNKLQQKIIKEIKKNGKIVVVRGLKTREVIDYFFSFSKLESHVYSNEEMKYIVDKINKYSSDFRKVLDILKKDLSSRRAVLLFNKYKKNAPECLLSCQFMIRNKKLTTIVTSRSMDVINKFFTDTKIASTYSEFICEKFNVKLNKIVFDVGSLHFYIK